MTHEFKPGDRVRYNERRGYWDGRPMDEELNGIEGVVERQTSSVNVKVKWDGNAEWAVVYPENLELVKAADTRPLVGPAPKVEAPKYVAPFKARGHHVVDASGTKVLAIDAQLPASDIKALAAYVAEALNAFSGTS